MKLLILVEYDERTSEDIPQLVADGVRGAFANLDSFARIDIEGVDGVTRESILSDVMHVSLDELKQQQDDHEQARIARGEL